MSDYEPDMCPYTGVGEMFFELFNHNHKTTNPAR